MPDAPEDTDTMTTDTTTAPDPTTDGTPPATDDAATAPSATDDTPPAEELGDAGQKALKAERKARADAERELAKARRKIEEAERAQLSDTERAVAEAEARGRSAALAESSTRLVKAEVRAAAAGKLANPALAVKLVDLDALVPEDGADIDTEAVEAAVDALVDAEPYLAATPPATGGTDDTPPPKVGTVAGGARGDTAVTFKRSQLRDPEFYAANKDAILAAAAEGRITND